MSEAKLNDFETHSIFKLFIKYLIPSLIGTLALVIYSVMDRYFVGFINENAVAGVGIAFNLVMIFVSFSMLVGVGSATLIAIKLGQNNQKDVDKVLGNAITLFFLFGMSLFFILKFNMNYILVRAGANSETLPYAREYMSYLLYGIIPLQFSYGLSNIVIAAGAPKMSMFSMIMGGVINVVLEAVLMFGFGMGVKGVAIGTLTGTTLSAIYMLHFVIKNKLLFKFNLFGFKLENHLNINFSLRNLKLSPKLSKSILIIGMASFILQISSSLVSVRTMKVVESLGGTTGVAIIAIICHSILPVITMTIYSISQAIQPIIGYNYGAKKYGKVKKILNIGIITSVIVAFVFFIILIIFPKQFILFFNKHATELFLKEAVKAMRIYYSLIIFASIGIIIPNYFQATERPRYSVVLNLFRQVFLYLVIMTILSNKYGLMGVWYAQPATDLLFGIILVFFYVREIKSLNKKQVL